MKTRFLLAAALLGATLTASAQSTEQVIGCWKMPARAGETLQFLRNGSFNFHDYNTSTRGFEYLYGTYQVEGNTLTLLYDDRPKQRFTFRKDSKGTLMLTKAGGFQFVKTAASDCTAE